MRGRPAGSKNVWPSDTQRDRLYVAEREVGGFDNVEFANLSEVRKFVQRFIRRKAWTQRTDVRKVTVSSNARRHAYAMGYGLSGELDLSPGYFTKMIIAHELAHIMCPPTEDRPAHGREFAGTYLYLVSKLCGKAAKDELIKAFFRYNVDWDSTLAS